ncbi:MAG TPA: hypothetical protein VN083_10330, partial [Vicinamibacteria bacterium]|nr:hypothetical protein [Vicinamibacteria bacterium]
ASPKADIAVVRPSPITPSPEKDAGVQLAERQMEEARSAMEDAKRALKGGDARAGAQEAAAQDLARQGRIAEAAQSYRQAASLYRSAREDRQAVLDLLHRYEAAIAAKDLNVLKTIWPTLPEKAIRDGFSAVRSQRVTLEPGDVRFEGDQAAVTCQRHDEILTLNGTRVENRTAMSLSLQRRAGAWTIASIN